MTPETRRGFLTKAVAAAAVLRTAPSRISAGANDKVVAALIGCGGRGPSVVKSVKEDGNVSIAYACDPDEERAGKIASQLGAKAVSDFRRVLDDKSVDAVLIATPDHWHAPAAILALESGKHAYVEKPVSHNIREGRLLLDAARRTALVVQHGTQSRSNPMIVQAIQALREGVIGEVLVAKAYNVQLRRSIGRHKPAAPPAGFDFDLWTGPAEKMPWQQNRHHYDWHWWYNYGTGDIGNDGAHELDIGRWGLGVDQHPSRIAGQGGKLAFDDDQEFPDTAYVQFEYPGDGRVGSRRQLVFEMRLWSDYGLIDGNDNGNAFYGTSGWMFLTKRGSCRVYDSKNKLVYTQENLPVAQPALSGHGVDFVQCIRDRRRSRADAETAHLSTTLCHLANISVRIGRSLTFDPRREILVNDDDANRLVLRRYRQGAHWAIPKGV